MNIFKQLYTRVLSLIVRVITIVAVGFASFTFRSKQHSFIDNWPHFFCCSNALKASQKFLAATIICTILAFAMVVTPAEASIPYVRKEAHSPEAQQDLKSLKIALDKMRKMPCGNPLSWYYQGAIHWVPTGDYETKYLDGTYRICPSYNKVNHKLQKAWNNCTHFNNSLASNHNFLVWHRFYLYHFENIVRSLSGDENFALPYWGYIDLEDSTKKNKANLNLTMPEAFRVPADDSNSLFEYGRFSKLLNGEKIEADFAALNLYEAVEGLRRKDKFFEFNKEIEQQLHGGMHDYIGGGDDENHGDPHNKFNKIFNGVFNGNAKTPEWGDGLMADVISAGFDPIFWMHHGNIDRLWDQWTNTTTAEDKDKYVQLNESQDHWQYTFFDPEVLPDGTITSKEVNYTLDDVIDKVYNLGYHYDDTLAPPLPKRLPTKRLREKVSQQPSAPPKPFATQEVGQVVSSDRPIDLKLPLNPQIATELGRLRANTSAPTAIKGFTLKIDVTYTGRPYGSYDVFLNLPNEESKSDIDTYYAGSMSFFVIPSPEPVTETFQFDITDELLLQLEKLGEAMDNETYLISIRKESGTEDEFVKIERISIYAY